MHDLEELKEKLVYLKLMVFINVMDNWMIKWRWDVSFWGSVQEESIQKCNCVIILGQDLKQLLILCGILSCVYV